MWEDYSDMPYEPTQFEIDINELIQKEIKLRMGNTVTELESALNRCNDKDKIISELRKELRDIKFNWDNNLKIALIEKEKETERRIGLWFAVNDTVYYAKTTTTSVKCDKCNNGNIEVEVFGNKTKAKCPFCSYGKIYTDTYSVQKDIIVSIKYWISRKDKFNNKTAELKRDWKIEVYLNNKDDYIDSNKLFYSKKECQNYCDEKNNITKEDL
jgi:hypothetical protein